LGNFVVFENKSGHTACGRHMYSYSVPVILVSDALSANKMLSRCHLIDYDNKCGQIITSYVHTGISNMYVHMYVHRSVLTVPNRLDPTTHNSVGGDKTTYAAWTDIDLFK
jgi:hypothetical protein